jgi:hypothetical protein
MNESKIIDYKPKGKNNWGENISVLLNQSFVITNVEFEEGAYGAVAIFTVGDDGKKYYTSSKVLTKQAVEIAQLIKEGHKVRVTLRRVKRYLTF